MRRVCPAPPAARPSGPHSPGCRPFRAAEQRRTTQSAVFTAPSGRASLPTDRVSSPIETPSSGEMSSNHKIHVLQPVRGSSLVETHERFSLSTRSATATRTFRKLVFSHSAIGNWRDSCTSDFVISESHLRSNTPSIPCVRARASFSFPEPLVLNANNLRHSVLPTWTCADF